MMAGICRGALIVLEGCDRAGKTTQCNRLVAALRDVGHDVKQLHFPDRSTILGKEIDKYLKQEQQMHDRAIHLIFSANRWEHESEMRRLLLSGTTLVVDRYAYSGVAFTAAKNVASLDWCKGPDRGLPAPDIVLFLKVSTEVAEQRANYGEERYEKKDFQAKVEKQFELLRKTDKAVNWEIVDASRDIDKVHNDIFERTIRTMSSLNQSIATLWEDCDTHS